MRKRYKHDLSHYRLFTANMGELVPCGLVEVLPGDTFQHNVTMLLRMEPMVNPVMHPTHACVWHFFVPYRLIWDDFEDFITGGRDGKNDSVRPYINTGDTGFPVGSLGDYLGSSIGTKNMELSALPFRAYAFIWNEYFRDQDLQEELVFSTDSGEDKVTSTTLQNVCWRKDMFTVARPWTQKGDPIYLPLGLSAPVSAYLGDEKQDGFSVANFRVFNTDANPNYNMPGALFVGQPDKTGSAGYNNAYLDSRLQWNKANGVGGAQYPRADLRADLTQASALNVIQLRAACAMQRYQENAAKYGSSYRDYLNRYGIRCSDARLHLPEYLGGGLQTLQFSEVLQTAEGAKRGVGAQYGHGIGALKSNRYRRFFEEHGLVLSVMTVRPIPMYMNAIQRLWLRRTKEDFFQEELQFIGEQEVYNCEVEGVGGDDQYGVFGYIPRYDEYKSVPNTVHGEFRSIAKTWHFGRDFGGSVPVLNSDFVRCVPSKRPFAIESQDYDSLNIMAYHSLQSRRFVRHTQKSMIL